jgi:hypothetical protein
MSTQMSTQVTVATAASLQAQDKERGHRRRVIAGYILFITLIVALTVHGFDYYSLGATDRPFSPKHHALRPSGRIGVNLGMLGFAMFLVIFIYPLRKRWDWLRLQGNSKHWLDYHVILGIFAPFVIAFHSSFKFAGFAGMAFWIMVAVSISGIIGRYLYAQIPRSLNAAELTRNDTQALQLKLAAKLAQQKLLPVDDLRSFLRLPSPERVQRWSAPFALVYMMTLDLARPFRIAKLRRHSITSSEKVTTLGGFLRTKNRGLEKAISSAREEVSLSKRILFLSRSKQVFELWHVVHKPFSYSFAMLAIVHIVVVTMMGFF